MLFLAAPVTTWLFLQRSSEPSSSAASFVFVVIHRRLILSVAAQAGSPPSLNEPPAAALRHRLPSFFVFVSVVRDGPRSFGQSPEGGLEAECGPGNDHHLHLLLFLQVDRVVSVEMSSLFISSLSDWPIY